MLNPFNSVMLLWPILIIVVVVFVAVSVITIPILWRVKKGSRAERGKFCFEVILVVLVFVTIGGFVGVATANTRTPIMGDVLPALITFLTALTAFLFNRSDSKATPTWHAAMAPAIVGMLLATMWSSTLGSRIRVQYEEQAKQVEAFHILWLDACKEAFQRSIVNHDPAMDDSVKACQTALIDDPPEVDGQ